MQSSGQPWDLVLSHLGKMPHAQLVLVLLFLAFSIIAGNAVFALHYRRKGQSAWSVFNPAKFPLFDFNAREALLLGAVVLVSFAILFLALLIG